MNTALASAMRQMAGKRVYIDTNIFIYFFNQSPPYLDAVAHFLKHCAQHAITGMASDLVLAEILVRPYREKNTLAIAQIQAFF